MFRFKTAHRFPAVAATFTFALVVAGASHASAQGFNWTGGYIGGHVGNATGIGDTTVSPLPDAAIFINLKPINAADPLDPAPKGLVFGGQGGYNYQTGHFVVGGEGVFSISQMKGTVEILNITQNNGVPFDTDFPGAGSFLSAGVDTKWMLHIRARAGVQAGQALIFGAFGRTIASVNYTANAHFGPEPFFVEFPADVTETKQGWHWGAGVEVAASNKVSVFGEFFSFNLKDRASDFAHTETVEASAPNGFQVAYTWQTKATVLRGGVNFRF